MFCSNCGTDIGNASFCPNCGMKIIQPSNEDGVSDISVNTNAKTTINEKNNIAKIVAFSSMCLAVLATFLPFFSISVLGYVQTISLWDKNFIVLTIIGMIFLAVELGEVIKNTKNVGRDSIIIGALILLELVFQYAYNRNRLTNIDTGYGSFDASHLLQPGVGLYLLAISGIGLIVAGILYLHGKD